MCFGLSGCGDSGSAPSPTPSGSRTETFSGSAQIGAGGMTCSSNAGHPFTSGQGDLVITLVQSTDTAVAVQVCHPTATNHATECTVPPFHRLGVGLTVRATLKGGRSQVLTVYPQLCGAPGAVPTSIDYTVSVEHPN
jgi:hypothetical protein